MIYSKNVANKTLLLLKKKKCNISPKTKKKNNNNALSYCTSQGIHIKRQALDKDAVVEIFCFLMRTDTIVICN